MCVNQTSCASPSDIVNSNERINPRSVTEEYNLPVCLMNQDASTVESSSTKKSSPGEKAVAYNYFANPFSWDTMDGKEEPDDYLHDPEMPIPVEKGSFRYYVVSRGFANLGVLILLCTALVMLFAGYPIIAVYKQRAEGKKGGFNLGGTNATGQVANFPGIRTGLIDPDTPRDAYEINSLNGDKKMELVFSDEFNTEGRSFYPGDDPYWEAVDLHYWVSCRSLVAFEMIETNHIASFRVRTTTSGTHPKQSPRVAVRLRLRLPRCPRTTSTSVAVS